MANRRHWKQWSEEHARQVLDEADRSGLSDSRFARDQGIRPDRIARWRKRLGGPQSGAGASGKLTFVELKARPRSSPGGADPDLVKVHLQNGRQVEVPLQVDLVALCRLLDAVEGHAC
jgi:transposase-like protein